jgi:glucokinase
VGTRGISGTWWSIPTARRAGAAAGAVWRRSPGARPWPRGPGSRAGAPSGHPVAIAALRRAGRALGLAIASATHLCDLDVIAIGGGLSQAGPLLFDPIEETLRVHARMDYAREARVVPAALGQTAGLIGAAALVYSGDRYWSAD